MPLNPDPSGSSLSESAGSVIQTLQTPFRARLFSWQGMDSALSHPNCARCPPLCVVVKQGLDGRLPLARARLPKKPIQGAIRPPAAPLLPQLPPLTHGDQTLGIWVFSFPLKDIYSSIEKPQTKIQMADDFLFFSLLGFPRWKLS